MDLDALRFGNFSKLGEAITDWEQMTKKLADLQKDAESNLKAKAVRAKWVGVNATVTREFVDKTAAEFADAHTQADSITKILKDTRGELIDYRTQLNDAIERGAKQNLTVIDTGEGTFTVTANTRPDWASDPSGQGNAGDQKAVNALRDEIKGILSKAAESDNTAAKVLNLLVDQAKYGFSDASYADRDSAAKAVVAAEELAKMAKDPAKMTLDDIAAFNRSMELYREDPLFAEQFARRLGPKDTLQFWTEMTYAHAGARGSELDTMKSLQKNLSLTLATASFSESDAMRQWKKDLLAESNTAFRPTNQFSPIGPLGTQVLSSLMRHGQYDTEFLDQYRKQLFAADQRTGSESDTDTLWVKGYDGVDLVFGDGNGRDPLEGLFEGLSHSPEAALHAFTSKSNLDHMLGTTAYTDRGASLGHALEAAVTGVALGDSTNAALPHSETQVQLMANIMEAVAQPDGGADLVGRGMGESFGHMAASYMPEISRAFGGPSSEAVFLTNSDAPSGLKQGDVTRFLSAVALDPSGRAGITYGESIYTGSLLDAHLSDPSLFDGDHEQALKKISGNVGIIEGIVGRSIADAEIEKDVDAENDFNDSLESQGDFFNVALSSLGGYGVAAVAPTGPAGAGVAGAGAFATGAASMAIKALLDGKEMEGALDGAVYRTGQDLDSIRESASQMTQWSVQDALQRHHVDLPEQATNVFINDAVIAGWESSDTILSEHKKRPN
jgi:hypothetical protein